jgi:hypothetical protein
VQTTGYGTGEGLLGYNCRHIFYPFFEDISEREYSNTELDSYADQTVTYNGKEMSVYDATQLQRGIERKIRYWKRQARALEAAGLDNTEERLKIGHYQAEMRDFIKQMNAQYEGKGLEGTDSRWQRQRGREQVAGNNIRGINPPERKTVGFSFLSGETNLHTTAEARKLGKSSEGWEKNERIFRQDYLDKYKLIDDVERTLGYWGGPEPSFNAHLQGTRENMIRMAKAWGKNYNQQGMAMIIPNPKGTGGKLIWDFGRNLSNSELDLFFKNLDDLNKELGEKFNDYFGVTVKGSRNVEYWFSQVEQGDNAFRVIDTALGISKIPVKFRREKGYDFILLMQGEDY